MRRALISRYPAFASRREAERRRPLWRRPLALIFRARREAPPAPAPILRCADGARITLAARLQVAVHLWTHLSAAHRHSAVSLHMATFGSTATAIRIFRSTHLHFHQERGPSASAPLLAEAHPLRLLERVAARPDLAMASLPGRAIRAAREFAPRAPAARPVRDERIRPRLHPALAEASAPSRRPTASEPGILADPTRRLSRRRPVMATGPAARRPVLASPAGAPRARERVPVSLPESPASPSQGRAEPDALPPRLAGPAPILELAAPSRARAGAAQAAHGSAPARRGPPPPPPLDYRRPAPPPVSAAAPALRPEPPAAPAINLDALSREVIGRIEKRLRIERERHGRV